MIAPEGTFAYVVIAPGPLGRGTVTCDAALRAPIDAPGDRRLAGYRPQVHVTEAGLTPEANSQRPWVMRSRITLVADSAEFASAAEVSFHVDQALLSAVQAGDEIHLRRTACGGLGLSILRGGRLVAAAGAITTMPLGNVTARIPSNLTNRAEAVFREQDPEFSMPEYPLEVEVDGRRSILMAGTREFGDYRVHVEHGHIRGLPGTDECASIYDVRACPAVAAAATALLLKNGEFTIRHW